MVFAKFVSDQQDLDVFHEIYRKVFVEELSLDVSSARADEFYINAVVYDKEIPAGIGRIMFDGERFTISDVAVLPEHRGEKYGDFLVRLLVDKALMSNAQEIYLDAYEGTEGFFGTIGFEKDGAAFPGYGGMWQPMILKSDRLHKCCNCGH